MTITNMVVFSNFQHQKGQALAAMHILNGDRAFRLTLLDLLAHKGRKRLSFDRVFELPLTPAPLLQQWVAMSWLAMDSNCSASTGVSAGFCPQSNLGD